MKAPKFYIITIILVFVGVLLLPPRFQNDLFINSLILLTLALALTKNIVFSWFTLLFIPCATIIHQKCFSLLLTQYKYFTADEKENNLLIQLTCSQKTNDFQFQFCGEVIHVNGQKSKGKILLGINRDLVKI